MAFGSASMSGVLQPTCANTHLCRIFEWFLLSGRLQYLKPLFTGSSVEINLNWHSALASVKSWSKTYHCKYCSEATLNFAVRLLNKRPPITSRSQKWHGSRCHKLRAPTLFIQAGSSTRRGAYGTEWPIPRPLSFMHAERVSLNQLNCDQNDLRWNSWDCNSKSQARPAGAPRQQQMIQICECNLGHSTSWIVGIHQEVFPQPEAPVTLVQLAPIKSSMSSFCSASSLPEIMNCLGFGFFWASGMRPAREMGRKNTCWHVQGQYSACRGKTVLI